MLMLNAGSSRKLVAIYTWDWIHLLLFFLDFFFSFFLRLISWTGRKIDPVGVDYILQKLGFHHARTTIPKWLQRGVMDPLDKVLSVLIKKLGTALQDEKEKKGKDKEEYWSDNVTTTIPFDFYQSVLLQGLYMV